MAKGRSWRYREVAIECVLLSAVRLVPWALVCAASDMAAGLVWSLVACGSAAKVSDASFRFRHFKGSGRCSFLTNNGTTPLPPYCYPAIRRFHH